MFKQSFAHQGRFIKQLKQPFLARRDRDPEVKTKKGITICIDCHSVHERKSWKNWDTQRLVKYRKMHPKVKVHNGQCPACKMVKEHQYGGKVLIEHIPTAYAREVMRLVRSFLSRAVSHESQHRLIAIEGTLRQMVITTTENQVAARLGEKIRDTFKKRSAVVISFSREPYKSEFVRVIFAQDGEALATAQA
jgi:NMD protein affecting ribosome stability and mRNA decay